MARVVSDFTQRGAPLPQMLFNGFTYGSSLPLTVATVSFTLKLLDDLQISHFVIADIHFMPSDCGRVLYFQEETYRKSSFIPGEYSEAAKI